MAEIDKVDPLQTRPSLLVRLGNPADNMAWEDFYLQYKNIILHVARKQGLDHHGAMDVLQETSVVLMKRMTSFNYDPGEGKFRNWLQTVVYNKVREARRRNKPMESLDGAKSEETAAPIENLQDEGETQEQKIEKDWNRALINEALEQLAKNPKVKARTIEIYRACKLEGRDPEEVARKFGISRNAVDQRNHTTKKALQPIIEALSRMEDARLVKVEVEEEN